LSDIISYICKTRQRKKRPTHEIFFGRASGGSNRFRVIPAWNVAVITVGSSDPAVSTGRSIDEFFAKVAGAFVASPPPTGTR